MKKVIIFIIVLFLFFQIYESKGNSESQKIKEISYTKSTYGVIITEICVDLKTGTAKEYENPNARKGGNPMTSDKIPSEQFKTYKIKNIENYEDKFKHSGVLRWKKEYKSNIFGVPEWSLVIKFENGNKKIVGGNKQPRNFDKVFDLLTEYD
ncbi:hypothetical protein BW731_02170 [Vagococcus martis]|uniref:Uncharacterized protein n=1 Tax=Vagococcus martis TaxID=1768210 RepID=A0A1V4DEW3_9ENTE|nr:hypothetical protein [Vagococcus martis]OPF87094.1 hypothetical protein BW731_02170 [Vagococcus martis]